MADKSKLTSALKVTSYDHDPDGTSAVDVAWVDMRDFECFMVEFFRTVGTSALTFTILANAASDGSGTDVTVKTVTPAAAPDATGDYVFAEVTATEIQAAAAAAGVSNARYVSANLTFATGTDEAVVTYIRGGGKKELNNTADVVA